ncbi:Fructose-bisphosphate aldolase [Collinsella sp. AK_207A]|uniref:class II fructose-bisphosphate aldolase n=1 Tax=Collinsella sp. AK_207A TaxID=2650472 RepID=UPI0012607399|nr:class II fructose-bisphosphate aldolase [Collinsella sp. AK_207A]VWL92479.1 Fructose-bisphosphate aldolase [Collinsella sp. AK_207A]
MYESMKGMLAKANAEGYAVMAINAVDLEMARGIITAAEQMNAPIIIDLLQDQIKRYFDCDILTQPIIKMAQAAHVPVAINLDHGHDIAHLKRCLHEGFSSVMCDASALSPEENAKVTRGIVELAQTYGASVEAEVGNMGCSVGADAHFTDDQMYTDPDVAIKFIQDTGVDCLAVSYGSTHGDYPEGYVPTFHFDIVEKIKASTGAPLVLHGGSGTGDENMRRSVEVGINKINVGTDYMIAQREFVAKTLAEDPGYNWPQLLQDSWAAGMEVVKRYIELSGSANKAF